MLAAAAAA
uniref:Uncharacterized protein n=1 Tax=Arundo donax TaxID=35708 RepID=A0A0A9HNY7_ARUDO